MGDRAFLSLWFGAPHAISVIPKCRVGFCKEISSLTFPFPTYSSFRVSTNPAESSTPPHTSSPLFLCLLRLFNAVPRPSNPCLAQLRPSSSSPPCPPHYCFTRALHSGTCFCREGAGHMGGANTLGKLAEAGHTYNQPLGKTTLPPVNSAGPACPRLRWHDVTARRHRRGCRDGPKMAGRVGSASARRAEPHSFPRS